MHHESSTRRRSLTCVLLPASTCVAKYRTTAMVVASILAERQQYLKYRSKPIPTCMQGGRENERHRIFFCLHCSDAAEIVSPVQMSICRKGSAIAITKAKGDCTSAQYTQRKSRKEQPVAVGESCGVDFIHLHLI